MTNITWTNDTRKLSDLVPWEHNPKRMTRKQAEGLRLSIERFGFAVPFLVSPDGDIYDGHQRQTLMGAIKQYGPNAVVDVRVSSRPLDDDERRELVVRLKQNQAGWDFDMLPNLYEREELLEWGFEPEELGMFADEPQGEDPGAQVDKAEELREKWGVKTGDLWGMGEHRLICGDCTDAAVVERVMGGERAALFATDPPYGANAGNIGFTAQRDELELITNDDLVDTTMQRWLETVFCTWVPVLNENAAWYLWHPMLTQGYFAAAAAAAVIIHRQIIWVKEQFIFGRGDYHWQHELCFFGWIQGHRPPFYGERNQSTVWRVPWGVKRSEIGHPTAKPSELWDAPIRNHTKPGEICAEPFCGSGAQIIACERLGRRCRAVEIAPRYVAVALQRFYDMTGIEPVLLEPGNSDLTVISNG